MIEGAAQERGKTYRRWPPKIRLIPDIGTAPRVKRGLKPQTVDKIKAQSPVVSGLVARHDGRKARAADRVLRISERSGLKKLLASPYQRAVRGVRKA